MLESLNAERQRGHFKNLVVAPTGTGKTWVSAFDYDSLAQSRISSGCSSLHTGTRSCVKARKCFASSSAIRHLASATSGSERPATWTHVFASIQSLHRSWTHSNPTSSTWLSSTSSITPKPTRTGSSSAAWRRRCSLANCDAERADGNDILHWFDDRIAYEMRLWEALDRGLLSPFHYLGIGDGTDLRRVRFERGRYVTERPRVVLTGDHVRAQRILEASWRSGCLTRLACVLSGSAPVSSTLGSWPVSSPSARLRRGRPGWKLGSRRRGAMPSLSFVQDNSGDLYCRHFQRRRRHS